MRSEKSMNRNRAPIRYSLGTRYYLLQEFLAFVFIPVGQNRYIGTILLRYSTAYHA